MRNLKNSEIGEILEKDKQVWAVRYDGPIPSYRYFTSHERAKRHRDQARLNGYHVLLLKMTEDVPNAPTEPDAGNNDNKKFLQRLRERFQRNNR